MMKRLQYLYLNSIDIDYKIIENYGPGDRLCGLVVRVSGYRYRGPALPDFSE